MVKLNITSIYKINTSLPTEGFLAKAKRSSEPRANARESLASVDRQLLLLPAQATFPLLPRANARQSIHPCCVASTPLFALASRYRGVPSVGEKDLQQDRGRDIPRIHPYPFTRVASRSGVGKKGSAIPPPLP